MAGRFRAAPVWGGLLAIGFVAGYAWAQIPKALYINGQVASTNVIEKDRRAYVPLVDIAKALDMGLSTRPGGYDMVTKAAPPAPPATVSGKIGEAVSNGQLTLTVIEIVRRETYAKRYIQSDVTAERGHEIVAVVCRLRNDTGREAHVDLSGGSGTALGDSTGRSYPQRVGLPDAAFPAVKLVPQTAVEFAILFEMPKATVPSEFRYEPLITQDSHFKGGLFRIALAKDR